MSYTKIQFVALNLNTSKVRDTHFYFGEDDEDSDIYIRIALIRDAIQDAFSRIRDDDSKLNVFMAPEFFWRGKNGAYKKGKLEVIETELAKLVEDDKYKNWLFIFGTVLVSEPRIFSNPNIGNYKYTAVSNSAVIIEGGKNGSLFRAAKTYLSGVDFLQGSNNTEKFIVGGKEKNIHHRQSISSDPNEQGLLNFYVEGKKLGRIPAEGGCVFTAKGLRFAIEICLDHDKSVVKDFLINKMPSGKVYPQIVLIPSCGMNIRTDNTLCDMVDDSIVFNVDGARPTYNQLVYTDWKWGNKLYKMTNQSSIGAIRYKITSKIPKRNVFVSFIQLAPLINQIVAPIASEQKKLSKRLKSIAGLYVPSTANVADEKKAAYRMFVHRIYALDPNSQNAASDTLQIILKINMMLLVNRNSGWNRREITNSFKIMVNHLRTDTALADLYLHFSKGYFKNLQNRKTNNSIARLSYDEFKQDILDASEAAGDLPIGDSRYLSRGEWQLATGISAKKREMRTITPERDLLYSLDVKVAMFTNEMGWGGDISKVIILDETDIPKPQIKP